MTADAALALATPLAVIIAAVITQLSAIRARRASLVKLEAIAKTAESVHTLVNSAMSAQLRISAIALRRLADLSKHPADAAAASLAEDLYREHEARQKLVDAKAGEVADLKP